MKVNISNQPGNFGSPARETTGKPKVEIQRDVSSDSARIKTERLHELKRAFAEHNISLSFDRDEQTNQVVIKMVDANSGKTIRQTPTEVSLKLTAIYSKIQGQFLEGNF
ncbi:MAG: hypothetical protein HKN25_07255 [Pyrinomonadaceae bacterium]|nr:hypothetical protein [Pyrinomonadaceae bacterium]